MASKKIRQIDLENGYSVFSDKTAGLALWNSFRNVIRSPYAESLEDLRYLVLCGAHNVSKGKEISYTGKDGEIARASCLGWLPQGQLERPAGLFKILEVDKEALSVATTIPKAHVQLREDSKNWEEEIEKARRYLERIGLRQITLPVAKPTNLDTGKRQFRAGRYQANRKNLPK